MWLGHASRRRRHGRFGPQRRVRHSRRPALTAAVVIGGGADALVASRALASAGHPLTVIDEYASPSRDVGWVPPAVAKGLSGLAIERPDPWLTVALPDGGKLELWRDMARSAEAIGRVSPRDAERWPEFSARMAKLARLLEGIYLAPPPGVTDFRFALKIRRLGRLGMEDVMRLLPMPAAEWLDDWFESDALKGALAALAIVDLQQGPRSAGTAFRLLHHHVGSPPGVFRPPRSNLREVLRQRVKVRSGKAARILIRAGKVYGVALENGEELAAALVVSAGGTRRSLVELVEPGWLDPDLARAVRNVRSRGVAAKMEFQTQGAAKCPLVFAPSLDYLERAYDHAKYGDISTAPYVEVTAEGEAHVQFTPYAPRNGAWDDSRRQALGGKVAELLEPYLGNVEIRRVLAPPDLEAQYGWPHGQPHDAELSLDQALWMRPLPELAGYRTPIEGLWLCGPGMHPGGAIPGASGYNCAREILSTLKS
jgi:phytoene dehydrogenase-like protein